MKYYRSILVFSVLVSFFHINAQKLTVPDTYLILNAAQNDPLYTTYTACIERSGLYSDKGYKMDYSSGNKPINYSSDQSGSIFSIWEVNQVVIKNMDEYHSPPVITTSFPDMAIAEYKPWMGLEVQETFFVYSSDLAIVNIHISNKSDITHDIQLYPVLEFLNDSLFVKSFSRMDNIFTLEHYETKKRLISNLYSHGAYPEHWTDLFSGDFSPYSYGAYTGNMDDFYNIIKTDFYSNDRTDSLNLKDTGYVRFASLHARFSLKPGEDRTIRFFRGTQDEQRDKEKLIQKIIALKNIDIQEYVDQNIKLFNSIPRIDFATKDEKLVYISAFNLARSCMLPPEGKTSYNYYVFSREPLWGWGHGHQVLHESLSMLAYAYLDPESAQESQRVYMEQQGDDGLIAYRHGPRGSQTYPHKGMPTTSAPFYSWINWEVYDVSHDKAFLQDAYRTGVNYLNWLKENRDTDKDGLYEWGPYGIIENVRDWYNAVFQVSKERHLDIDKEDISDELECLDLSLMIVNEMRMLSNMALELGETKEAKQWSKEADELSGMINNNMWDEESEFFYHIDKNDHSFQFMTRDLKRQEIIGFLPLWAGSVEQERADQLIKTLTDTSKFWRKYGIPTLAADDEWYSPYVDYCCKWNGPVWLLWDYMIFQGLVNYGYNDLAIELADKMMLAVSTQLKKNNNFWESYSPDNDVLNCPSNYIWDAIMAKLLIEKSKLKIKK